jgi:hypothetical protein
MTQGGEGEMDLSDIIRYAWRDAEFKQRLLTAPRATLEALLGVTLPPDLVIHIHEQTATEMHLVLPLPPEGFDQD